MGRIRFSNTQISPKPRRCAKQDSFRVSDMRTSRKAGHCAALLLQSRVIEREEPNFDYQAKNALPKPGLKARLPSTAHQKQQRTSLREREAEKSLTAEAQKGPGSSPGPAFPYVPAFLPGFFPSPDSPDFGPRPPAPSSDSRPPKNGWGPCSDPDPG